LFTADDPIQPIEEDILSILVLYTDLRQQPSQLVKSAIEYQPGMTALDVLRQALGNRQADRINQDLGSDNQELIVSWYNAGTGDSSEIGGVGSLQWPVDNPMILAINYERASTSAVQLDEANQWSIKNYDDFLAGFAHDDIV
jgi:hypothetical protein